MKLWRNIFHSMFCLCYCFRFLFFLFHIFQLAETGKSRNVKLFYLKRLSVGESLTELTLLSYPIEAINVRWILESSLSLPLHFPHSFSSSHAYLSLFLCLISLFSLFSLSFLLYLPCIVHLPALSLFVSPHLTPSFFLSLPHLPVSHLRLLPLSYLCSIFYILLNCIFLFF